MTKKTESTTSAQLGVQLEGERKRHNELEGEVTAIGVRLGAMKKDYEQAVESGEADVALDKRDEDIFKAEREVTRAQIRLVQSKAEIETLEKQRAEALAVEREGEFLKSFDVLVEEKFVMAEMALTEFKGRMADIDQSARGFMNEAAKAGRDTHRLRISDNLRRQIVERLWPGFLTKSHPETFTRPLADVLESHVRSTLNIPMNGKPATQPEEAEATLNQ